MNPSKVYTHNSHFHFNDCDPAGIFYFGNVSNLCHRVYENWLTQLNPDWNFWFANSEWVIPIKNCTVDYASPMKAGQPFSIDLNLGHLSQTSFSSQYHAFHPLTKVTYFKATIVHVFVQKSTFSKTAVPATVRPLFEPFLTGRSE